ncbi:MAG: hypothetical protein KA170_00095 [Candidatus Promineofilum sp.]|nr:hypothetical protein [Promineifilum sp.]
MLGGLEGPDDLADEAATGVPGFAVSRGMRPFGAIGLFPAAGFVAGSGAPATTHPTMAAIRPTVAAIGPPMAAIAPPMAAIAPPMAAIAPPMAAIAPPMAHDLHTTVGQLDEFTDDTAAGLAVFALGIRGVAPASPLGCAPARRMIHSGFVDDDLYFHMTCSFPAHRPATGR